MIKKVFTIISGVLAAAFILPSLMLSADVNQPELTIPTLDQINCRAYCVYDKTADKIILSKEEDTQVYPASMTKIMTMQLGLDYLDSDDYLTVSQNAMDATTYDSTMMGLNTGEIVKVSELYYGMMLPSGNDAANVVGEGVIDALFEKYPSTSEEVGPDGVNASYFEEQLSLTSEEILGGYKLTAFALLMNVRAENIGCKGTHFVNANGLHDDNHYTTASDLTLIMANAALNDDFKKVINSPTHIFQATNVHTEDGWSMVKNTNSLLTDPWLCAKTPEGQDTHITAFVGGKTGTTSMAGTGMTVATVNENGHEVYIAVCGIPGDYYAYQTRYVASVTAYGNLACWESDPQTVIPGNLGDYQRFNVTDAEAPVYDPLMVPGDTLDEDFITDTIEEENNKKEDSVGANETTESTMEFNQQVVTHEEEPEKSKWEERKEKFLESPLVEFAENNKVATILILVILILILICIILLIIRSINKMKRKRRARKPNMRPSRSAGDYIR
ncbi:MAG: hypothetical protein MJ153_07130 [Clostridia bacterium]|nr:hypothetical protein [Clostridia bacterium]